MIHSVTELSKILRQRGTPPLALLTALFEHDLIRTIFPPDAVPGRTHERPLIKQAKGTA